MNILDTGNAECTRERVASGNAHTMRGSAIMPLLVARHTAAIHCAFPASGTMHTHLQPRSECHCTRLHTSLPNYRWILEARDNTNCNQE